MTVEQAFLEVEGAAHDYATSASRVEASGDPMGDVAPFEKFQATVRAYGAARALAAHVEACGDAHHHDVDKPPVAACGEGSWYCPKAKAIQGLGK